MFRDYKIYLVNRILTFVYFQPPIDPLQLLRALATLLTSEGGIKGPAESTRICG